MNFSNRRITLFTVVIACFAISGCTTTTPIYNTPEGTIASQIEPGDRVVITLVNNRIKDIKVTAVDEVRIQGTIYEDSPIQPKGAPVDEEWVDIFSVETITVSPVKTAGAALGGAAIVSLFAAGVVLGGVGVMAGGY